MLGSFSTVWIFSYFDIFPDRKKLTDITKVELSKLTVESNSMDYIHNQLVFLAIGVFISFSAKLFRIHPIPIKLEIIAGIIVIGLVWLIRHYDDSFYTASFSEQVRFVLIGYLPMRVVRWRKRR